MDIHHEEKKHLYGGFTFFSTYYPNKTKNKPLVFINGALQKRKASWGRFVTDFHKDYPIVLVDLPGSGESDIVSEDFDFEFLMEALKHMIDEYDFLSVNLVAPSYGALIGYYFSKKYPKKIDHLILTGAATRISENAQELIEKGNNVIRKTIKNLSLSILTTDCLLNKNKGSSIKHFDMVNNMLENSIEELSSRDQQQLLENNRRVLIKGVLNVKKPAFMQTFPTLIFTGEFDHFTLPSENRKVAQTMLPSYFLTVKNSDHLFYLEQYPVASKILRLFITDSMPEKHEECNEIEYFGLTV